MAGLPLPEGYHTATPYLIVDDGEAALAFYTRAFGVTETTRLEDPEGGKIIHAEFKIGNSMFMRSNEFPEMGFVSPKTLGGSPITLHLYVEAVDDAVAQAIEAGAEVVRPLQDQFYGDRSASLKDPFGHQWSISSHVEDLTVEEIKSRFAEMMKSSG
ncbi:MAG: PhnB protein [Verrucomicrobiales bacterium]|jgi:PhnB protein